MSSNPKAIDHRLRDKAYAIFGAAEAPCILFRVRANDEPVRNRDAAIDDDYGELDVASDSDVGKHDRVRQLSISGKSSRCLAAFLCHGRISPVA